MSWVEQYKNAVTQTFTIEEKGDFYIYVVTLIWGYSVRSS